MVTRVKSSAVYPGFPLCWFELRSDSISPAAPALRPDRRSTERGEALLVWRPQQHATTSVRSARKEGVQKPQMTGSQHVFRLPKTKSMWCTYSGVFWIMAGWNQYQIPRRQQGVQQMTKELTITMVILRVFIRALGIISVPLRLRQCSPSAETQHGQSSYKGNHTFLKCK